MVFHQGHWLTPRLCGSATPRLQPATPTRRSRRLFPALWLVFLGRFGNTRAATFFHNLIALLRHLPFLPPFAQWFLYRFSRCAFWLHTAIMSRRCYARPGMKPLNERLVWPPPFRLIVTACALVPLFFGAAWTWTFGFTPYRSHLVFIGRPLGLCCIGLAVGMLTMRRWAILLSIPLSAFVGLGAAWIAVISRHWLYCLLLLAGVSYALLISSRITTPQPGTK